jgi:hypothetical protein
MIYAIQVIGAPFKPYTKFGKSNDPASRLVQHQTSSPFQVVLLASADWPDAEEAKIHKYLEKYHVRGEWFAAGRRTSLVIDLLQQEDGLSIWLRTAASNQLGPGTKRRLGRILALAM